MLVIRARFGLITKPLCEKTRSTGAELAGTHNLDDNLWAAKLSYSIKYGYIFRDFALNVPAVLAYGDRTVSVAVHILARVPLERLAECTFLGPRELFSSYITNSYEHNC